MLLFISCSIHTMAQADYYYYWGNRIPLTLNENRVVVNIPKECDKTNERVLANVKVLLTIWDEDFEIFVISRSDFEKLTSLDFWEEDAKIVILTSSFFTEREDEVFETPYLNVKLKKEQDAAMLSSYTEKYKLRIVSNSLLIPLWYTLAVTQDSGKKPLECANELWESGDFEVSEPDLASVILIDDEAVIRNVTTLRLIESSGIFDLQGRRLANPPAKGVYIRDGKKVVR